MKLRKYTAAAAAFILALTLFGCSENQKLQDSTVKDGAKSSAAASLLAAEDMFTDRDSDASYDADNATYIDLSAGSVTVSKEGTYILSGTLNDGQITVNAPGFKVQLVLQNAHITSSSTAPLYIKNAEKVFITLADSSENSLSVTGEYKAIDENNIDAALFSKSDVCINGGGSLVINASCGHGIVSKDDLKITGGTLEITAAKHALSGKDSVRIGGGTLKLEAGTDGIHSENTDDTSKGYVYIGGGVIDINSSSDGIDASSTAQIDGGTLNIVSGGGSTNGKEHTGDRFGPRMQTSSDTADTGSSGKGIKGDLLAAVTGGEITVNSADDSLHTNGDAYISGGSLKLSSGDDAVHADNAVSISSGEISADVCYEGIEGLTVDISGGDISVTSSDDGINAAGGNDGSGFGGAAPGNSAADGAYINISGGNIFISSGGDGMDSNGNLTVSGGSITIEGPEDNGNSALDYDGSASISGGSIIAVGMSGMAQSFNDSSTQGSMLVTLSQTTVEGRLALTDSSGNTVCEYTPGKKYNSVVISCPDIKKGESYTLTAGGQTVDITMDSISYGYDAAQPGGQPGGQNGGGQPGGMFPGGAENKGFAGDGETENKKFADDGTENRKFTDDKGTPPEPPDGDNAGTEKPQRPNS